MAGPEVGDRAPDALLLDLERREVRLSSLWRDRSAVVVFLRYFGCPFCQTQVVALRDGHERIRETGADVGLVGHGDPDEAVAFADAKRLPFPLLLDRDRGAYRSYGLVQGRAMQILMPQVALPWIRAELSSETRQRGLKGGSFLQMPGTFVIDSGGVVRAAGGTILLAHRNRHFADAPSIGRLLETLRGLDAQA
jgi:peroxiredoxin